VEVTSDDLGAFLSMQRAQVVAEDVATVGVIVAGNKIAVLASRRFPSKKTRVQVALVVA
jgi:hypothetical protein